MTNEFVFANRIRESGYTELSTYWVLWALRTIEGANREGTIINPEWLVAPGRMITHDGLSDDEPPMTP